MPFKQIHINRTGGSSLASILQVPTVFETAKAVRQRIGIDAWDNTFTFTIVRNPFDRIVSIYESRKAKEGTYVYKSGISFEDFIHEVLVKHKFEIYNRSIMFAPCWDWLHLEGKTLVKRVLRQENLDHEWRIMVLYEEAFKELLPIKEEFPHHKATERKPYTEYHTPETVSICEKHFAADIDHFGYAYPGPSTRQTQTEDEVQEL